jgi:mRNA-degrading endonuclease RelE of RelBE toxin-antitoxin system
METAMAPSRTKEILDLAAERGPTKATVRKVADLLPEEQEGIDELLDAAAKISYRHTFLTVATAILEQGFKLDARYFREAATWAEVETQIATLSWRASGDVAGTLIETGLSGRLSKKLSIGCALGAARLIVERKVPTPMESCWELVRRLFRETTPSDHAERIMIMGLVEYVREPDLYEGVVNFTKAEGSTGLEIAAKGTKFCADLFEMMDKPLIDLLGNTFSIIGKAGSTVRRASEKVGRNDPCPCGSGKKHKKCCLKKDQQRGRIASGVAGKTLAEVEQEKEALLTVDRLGAASPAELARFAPAKVGQSLREPLLRKLCEGEELEAVARFAEEVEWSDEYASLIPYATMLCARKRKPELMARLLAVCGEHMADDEGRLPPAIELLQAEADPARYIELLQEYFAEAVDDEGKLQMLALGLINSQLPQLGIVVTRLALLVAENKAVRGELLKDLMYGRDSLGLPYKDMVQELMEQVFDEDDDPTASEKMDELRDEMKSARTAERRVREELAEKERSLRIAEKKIARQEMAAVIPFPGSGDDGSGQPENPRVKKLKEDREVMKGLLRKLQGERVELRRQVEAERAQQGKLRLVAASPPDEATQEDDGDLWGSNLEQGSRQVRLPEFGKRFRASLKALSPRVVRAALKRVGAMASGEAAAYIGEEQLKDNGIYRRLRVAKDYRLLYRYDGESLLIADLVHRSKLDQAVHKLRND